MQALSVLAARARRLAQLERVVAELERGDREDASERLARARGDVADQRRLVRWAREALSQTPKLREEPVYADHAFEVRTHGWHVTARVSVQREGGDQFGVFGTQTLYENVTASAVDEVHDAQPVAGVAADPLEAPEPAALMGELHRAGSVWLAGVIADDFESWRGGLPRTWDRRASDAERMNSYGIYLATNPGRVQEEIIRDIARTLGIPDPGATLRGR